MLTTFTGRVQGKMTVVPTKEYAAGIEKDASLESLPYQGSHI